MLVAVFAGPAAILSVLGNVDRFEINYKGAAIQFVGRATDDSLIFAIALVVIFVFALVTNLYYAAHIRETRVALKEMRDDLSNIGG